MRDCHSLELRSKWSFLFVWLSFFHSFLLPPMAEVKSSDLDVEFDSVEEFLPTERGDAEGHAEECMMNITEFVKKGNRAFRENRVEEALHFYSKAHLLKPGDPVVLSNRSAAFCRVSKLLRNRSASESEYRPLNGLDPTTHAELALKDAEKVLSVRSTTAKSYLLKATALILLERYEEARETLLLGLQIDPESSPLHKSLQDLEMTFGGSVRRAKYGKLQLCDDFECTLCFKLMYEPVTTPCGHSFCRSCLFQSMDHGNKCPMCRTVLFISRRTYPISVALNNIIQKNFPEEHAARMTENGSLENLMGDLVPLFVMDVVLPCQKLSLNIFEPRYRLMVRRIMEGNHRMGMVVIDPATGTIADYACEVEITECEPLPDGRFYLEVEGRRRFKILRSWDQDGYRVAEVEWIQDTFPLEGTPEREELRELVSKAVTAAQMLNQANLASRSGRRRTEGMPSAQDPELLSFWIANLLNLGPLQKLDLLRIRDTRERMYQIVSLRPGVRGCCIQ